MTDSIQIVALNDDEHTPEEVPAELPEPVNEDLLVKPQEPPTIFVKQEYNMQNEDTTLPEEPEDSTDGLQINDEETALSFEEHSIETKTGMRKSRAILIVTSCHFYRNFRDPFPVGTKTRSGRSITSGFGTTI